MKCALLVQFLLAFALLLCDAQSSFADMVNLPPPLLPNWPHEPPNLAVILTNLGLTTVIEYLVIYLILGRPQKARAELFTFLLFVNLITNPPAQLGVWIWGHWFLIELVVMCVEFVLLLSIFDRMFLGGKLNDQIGAGRTAMIVLVANLTSFVLGLLGNAPFWTPVVQTHFR